MLEFKSKRNQEFRGCPEQKEPGNWETWTENFKTEKQEETEKNDNIQRLLENSKV